MYMSNQKQIEELNKALENPNLSLKQLIKLFKKYISLH